MEETFQHNICLENVEFFKNKCRICLEEADTKVPLFEIQQGSIKYSELIREHTGLVIDYNEFLSNEICEICINALLTVIKFITNVKRSIEKFNNFLFVDVSSVNDERKFSSTDNDIIEIVSSEDSSPIHEEQCEGNIEKESNNINVQETRKLEEELSFGLKFKKSRRWKIEREMKCNEDDDIKIEKFISHKDLSLSELKRADLIYQEEEAIQKANYETKYKIIDLITEGTTSKQVLQCKECGVISQNRSAFVIHYRKHNGIRPYQCKVCFKLFTQIGTLNAHINRGHSRVRKLKENKIKQCGLYICDICNKKYTLRSSLVIHLRAHNIDSQLKCYFCSKCFIKSDERSVHIRIHHTGEKPYFCDRCGKTFAASTNLKTHMLTHSNEKLFKCEFCEKLMKSHDNLKRHILVEHLKKKEFICDYCGTTFAFKSRLLRHIKVQHTKKELNNCKICNRSFRDLKKHVKCHFGEKPFGCTMCHKSYYIERNFIKHYSKHDPEKARFKCSYDMCQSIFAKKSMLDFHIVKCHMEQTPFACSRCPRKFYRRGDLGKHMIDKHNTWLLPLKQKKIRRKVQGSKKKL